MRSEIVSSAMAGLVEHRVSPGHHSNERNSGSIEGFCGVAMIQFVCDFCSRVKTLEEAWILGLAAESLGVAAARREVTILPVWDRARAVHPLAVHFCSLECKDNYMAALFGPERTEEEVIVERAGPVEAETVLERTTVSPTTAVRKAGRVSTTRRSNTRIKKSRNVA